MFANPSDERIRDLLRQARTIAVVGLSDRPDRPSHGVARALQRFGYRIIPVNPNVQSVLGGTAVSRLADISEPFDLVDVFRHPLHVAGIVDECIELEVPALWLQEGVVDEPAARRAVEAGITVVMDRCIHREYSRLFGQ